jgi:hypothetical protein
MGAAKILISIMCDTTPLLLAAHCSGSKAGIVTGRPTSERSPAPRQLDARSSKRVPLRVGGRGGEWSRPGLCREPTIATLLGMTKACGPDSRGLRGRLPACHPKWVLRRACVIGLLGMQATLVAVSPARPVRGLPASRRLVRVCVASRCSICCKLAEARPAHRCVAVFFVCALERGSSPWSNS